jgi:hypothetical protein
MPTLPCHHEAEITAQVPPTIRLLNTLDVLHPDVLRQHGIQPIDYHGSLVFRSAIESIRGSYIASSTTGREGLVGDVLENLKQREAIDTYTHSARGGERYDFTIALQTDVFAALEVKGGEGNSINISTRPLWAREFGVWCHLDGAIVNQPAHGAQAIINRIANEMVRTSGKMVDMVFFKDVLCGTRARPCPKYPGREESVGLAAAPDIFLFPKRRPIHNLSNPERHDPSPPVHDLDSLRLPKLLLNLFQVPEAEYDRHIWQVQITLEALANGTHRRLTNVIHRGNIVFSSKSRAWTPTREEQ